MTMPAGKTTGALLTIGEVAALTAVPQHVLRYWEARLPQLTPVKRAGGRRLYRPEDVALVRDIQRLIDQDGFTLDGAARALQRRQRGGLAPQASAAVSAANAAPAPGGLDLATGAALRALRERLAAALG